MQAKESGLERSYICQHLALNLQSESYEECIHIWISLVWLLAMATTCTEQTPSLPSALSIAHQSAHHPAILTLQSQSLCLPCAAVASAC